MLDSGEKIVKMVSTKGGEVYESGKCSSTDL